jgi:hypothetical protein
MGIMLLFAVGHTAGFLTFRPASDEGRAVWTAMNTIRFSQGHASFSYGEFYIGFGLSITATQLFMSWLAWHISSMAKRGDHGWRAIAWALCVLQVVGVAISVKYFAAPPALFGLVVAGLLAWAASGRQTPVASAETGHSQHAPSESSPAVQQ